MEFFFFNGSLNGLRQLFVKGCCNKSPKKYENSWAMQKTCIFTMIFVEVEFYLAIA